MAVIDDIAQVLYIDLTRKQFRVQNRSDLFAKYLGGSGVAIHLLNEECPAGTDPLGEENPVVLAVGPLTGLFPLASKTVTMFKSPHTGDLGESHCGGRSAVAIRMAGYGAIVIKGKSEIPLYVAIYDNKVYFRDASSIWGLSSSFTVGRIIRENEPGAGIRTIMRIGSAGEKMITYAGVTTETYRHFGRLGLGAVFGSKRLKAIVVAGKRSLAVTDKRRYRKVYDTIFRAATESPIMQKYHDLGTAENILPLHRIKGLPTRNLTGAEFDQAEGISGEILAEQYLGRRLACSHCPVGCIHIAALREPYADESYFYKTSMISYDYEPLYALGSMLGIGQAQSFLRLMEEVEKPGLDVMSTGVILAWATEAMQRGLITTEETAGIKLKWGDEDGYRQAIRSIIAQPNDFFRALGRGVNHTASIYGGKEFALALGGNEMPGYHTGPAAHTGVAAGARHSHLDNAGYSIDQKSPGVKIAADLAQKIVNEESWRQILSSLVICFFARGIYDIKTVTEALHLAGHDFTASGLHETGFDIYRRKFDFKIREGFRFDQLHLPERILETPAAGGKIDADLVKSTIAQIRKALQ